MLELVKFYPRMRLLWSFNEEMEGRHDDELMTIEKENSPRRCTDNTKRMMDTAVNYLENLYNDKDTGKRILGKSRKTGHMLLKQVFMRIMIDKGLSHRTIGSYLEMDRTTIHHHDHTTLGFIDTKDKMFMPIYTEATEALKFLRAQSNENTL